MANPPFPPPIEALPEADISFPGIRGWLLASPQGQVVFMDIAPIGEVPPHAHGAQWGIVVEGEMVLTIGSETRTYRKGDSYYIPAGTVHSARFNSRVLVVDFFADPDRYRPKT
ncbi:MAG: cupin domain-containing protein [Acidobacteria bacterium]|nr:cupin domain-containing protein [Acidobacteriota bacterium]